MLLLSGVGVTGSTSEPWRPWTPTTLRPPSPATPSAQGSNPVAELLAHHDKAHDLRRAQDLQESLLLLSEKRRFIAAQFEHLCEDLGSLLLGELRSPASYA